MSNLHVFSEYYDRPTGRPTNRPTDDNASSWGSYISENRRSSAANFIMHDDAPPSEVGI